MPIKKVRVDDRLVHGQVVLSWSRKIGIDTLLIANDLSAKDLVVQSVMNLAVPPGIELSVSSVEDTAKQIQEGEWENQQCMLVVKDSVDLLRLHEAGFEMEEVNVGNASGGTGKVRLLKHCAASPEELAAWHELNKKGVSLIGQWVPDEKEENLNDVLDNLKDATEGG